MIGMAEFYSLAMTLHIGGFGASLTEISYTSGFSDRSLLHTGGLKGGRIRGGHSWRAKDTSASPFLQYL